LLIIIIIMKTSPLALAVFLGAVGSDFSVDAAVLTGSDRSAPSPSLFTKSKTLISKLNPRDIYPTAIGSGRDAAATPSETTGTGGSLHGIVGQVERNLASRRLLINQDEAAKRVQDAIAAANQAVKNRETSGVALPLDFNVDSAGTQSLTVRLRLPGVDRDLNVVIDTGSSSLAFCDKSLISEAKNISKTNYAQCVSYGLEGTCPDNSTGLSLAYSGHVFQGDVGAYNYQGEKVASMDNVSFAIMAFAQIDTCFGPQDGIFGVGYKGLNHAVELPSPDFNVSSLWNAYCDNPDQADFSQGLKTLGHCNTGNMTEKDLDPPLEQALVQDYNSGQITAAAFGVYLDYAATIGSKLDKLDTVVPSLGIFFRGDLAYDNQFYKNGKVQVAKTIECVEEEKWEYYTLNFTSIRVPGFNVTQSTVDLCSSECNKCITDTGNGYIMLPLPHDFCDRLINITSEDEFKELGSLYIDVTGADGDDITLSFPLDWLAEQLSLGYFKCTGTTGGFKLGLPIHQYYYTVYDMDTGNDTVSFVELNLSNETQAFIDGPELGGVTAAAAAKTISPTPQPTSKACFRHTVGISLLAWTVSVFVPSAAALIASL
jgi:hypothetical protein